jgi:tetratricopeptide (TPR) repeat protein
VPNFLGADELEGDRFGSEFWGHSHLQGVTSPFPGTDHPFAHPPYLPPIRGCSPGVSNPLLAYAGILGHYRRFLGAGEEDNLPAAAAGGIMLGGSSVEKPKRPCGACGKLGAPVRCPCKGESYCNATCQKARWLKHKTKCSVHLSRELVSQRSEFGDDAVERGRASWKVGQIFMSQGRYEEAQVSLLEAERIYRLPGLFGACVPSLAGTLHSLGCLYQNQGKYVDADQRFKDALLMFDSISDDLEVANVHNSLGATHMACGKMEQAAEQFEKARAIHLVHPNREHLAAVAVAVLNNLGVLHTKNGELDKAIDTYGLALSTWRSQLEQSNDPESSDAERGVATTLLNISQTLIQQNMLDEAMKNVDEALPLFRRLHGEKSPEAATALCQVGDIYRKQGKLDEALKVYNKALRYRKRLLGNGNADVATSITKVAVIHMDQGHLDEALVLFEQAAGIQRVAVGDHRLSLCATCTYIWNCCGLLGDHSKALASLREVHRIFTSIASPDEVMKIAERVEAHERLIARLGGQ